MCDDVVDSYMFVFRVLENEDGQNAMEQYHAMLGLLDEFKSKVLESWREHTGQIPKLLAQKILVMNSPLIEENFDPQLSEILRDVKIFKSMNVDDIPPLATALSDREDELFVSYFV